VRRFGLWSVGGLLTAVAIVIGLVARLFGIDRSLWLDEFSTLWSIEQGWRHVAARVMSFQGQTPVYYFAARTSVDLLGESEVALRMPSLLASAATALACAGAAHRLGGREAAAWAGAMAWMAFSFVQTGVNARPYALATLGVALFTLGFVGAVLDGRRRWRVGFVLGVCLAFWAHFVLVLPLAGLLLAHARYPQLRLRYPWRALTGDLAWVALAAAGAWPFLQAAAGRTQHVTWLAAPQHGEFAALLAPFALPVALSLTARQRRIDPVDSALLFSLVGTVVLLEAAWLTGRNLVSARYGGPIAVAAVVLAARCASRLARAETRLAALAFVAITLSAYVRTWNATGSFSGLGVEDWRQTVASATSMAREPGTVVLFRSGFVEEDLLPLGVPHAATRSPLRSPGAQPFPTLPVSLTHSWSVAGRRGYFENAVRPRLIDATRVLVIAQRATEPEGRYIDNVVAWCLGVYGPGANAIPLPGGRGVDAVLIQPSPGRRADSTAATLPKP
jgi:hypothetical protein